MDAKRIRQFLRDRKLYVIIIIIFATGFAAGFAASQAVQDPTNYLAIITTLVTISGSIGSMLKLFSDYRKSVDIPSLEYGRLIAKPRSFGEGGGTRKHILYLLQVKEIKSRGQKISGCEGFIDIQQAKVRHMPLYWNNGNRKTISIGLVEELQLFTLSSFILSDNSETEKRILFYEETEYEGHLGYGSALDYEKLDTNSEAIITVQVDHGGSAPHNPFRTTIKQIMETAYSE